MKKILFIMAALMAVSIFTGPSFAWQGRMAGMGNPYGLTIDDSDFLIHPSLITRGKGFNIYSHADFTYTDINQWDIDIDLSLFSPVNIFYDSSGDQFDYSGLIGTAFPLGSGRMGIFFEYTGMDRDLEGNADYDISSTDLSTSADYDIESDLDSFSLRLMYGLPIDLNCLNIGGEASLSYIDEKQSNEWDNNFGTSFLNHPVPSVWYWYESNTFYFQIPYDSDYWDAQFKASADGRICLDNIHPIDVTFTFTGGFIFSGDNEYDYETRFAGFKADADMDGDVDGYNLGAELWVRYLVDDDFSMPFLVRVRHRQKERDGKGTVSDPGNLLFFVDGFDISYTQKEEAFELEAGGGLDIKLSNRSRIATGLFYTRIDSTDDMDVLLDDPTSPYYITYDQNTPDFLENRISLKIGWETTLTDSASIRAGFNTFWGHINKEFVFNNDDPLGFFEDDKISLSGYHWGIMASFGGSIKLPALTLEPYMNAGYRDLHTDGDVDLDYNIFGPTVDFGGDMEEDRTEWFVGCGLSILFGD